MSRHQMLDAIRQNTALLSGLSHDLNNMIAGVLGYAHLLERDPDSTRRSDYLRRVREQAEACRDALNDLQIIASEPRLRPTRCRGTDILFFVASKYTNERIEIECSAPSEALYVSADIDLLRRALCALVDNSIAAICSRGDTGTVRLSVIDSDGTVVFRVVDSGPGLSPELNPEDIFRPTSTTKRKGNGVGFGLTVALSVAIAHGGDVWLESSTKQGCTFALSIPEARPK